jgi:RNA polymerase sigma factor (sigma-70 family)
MTRFVEHEFPRLVAALDLYVGSLHIAEELAQEALLRACMRWQRVGALDSPGGWTYRVAMNLATSHLRRKQAEARANRRASAGAADLSTDDAAEGMAVRAAVLTLPGKQRAAVILRYFLGMSAVEAAAALGTSAQAVRAATARGVAALQQQLRDVTVTDEEHADA